MVPCHLYYVFIVIVLLLLLRLCSCYCIILALCTLLLLYCCIYLFRWFVIYIVIVYLLLIVTFICCILLLHLLHWHLLLMGIYCYTTLLLLMMLLLIIVYCCMTFYALPICSFFVGYLLSVIGLLVVVTHICCYAYIAYITMLRVYVGPLFTLLLHCTRITRFCYIDDLFHCGVHTHTYCCCCCTLLHCIWLLLYYYLPTVRCWNSWCCYIRDVVDHYLQWLMITIVRCWYYGYCCCDYLVDLLLLLLLITVTLMLICYLLYCWWHRYRYLLILMLRTLMPDVRTFALRFTLLLLRYVTRCYCVVVYICPHYCIYRYVDTITFVTFVVVVDVNCSLHGSVTLLLHCWFLHYPLHVARLLHCYYVCCWSFTFTLLLLLMIGIRWYRLFALRYCCWFILRIACVFTLLHAVRYCSHIVLLLLLFVVTTLPLLLMLPRCVVDVAGCCSATLLMYWCYILHFVAAHFVMLRLARHFGRLTLIWRTLFYILRICYCYSDVVIYCIVVDFVCNIAWPCCVLLCCH